jgi:hypothetical protein
LINVLVPARLAVEDHYSRQLCLLKSPFKQHLKTIKSFGCDL